MLRETEYVRSYRLGQRLTAALIPCTYPLYAQFWHGLQVSCLEQKPWSENSLHLCWRCCVDEALQVSQFSNSVWILVDFLSQSRFMRLRKLAKSDHELYHVCLSVCPSFRAHGIKRLPLEGFSWNLIFEYFQKSVKKIQVLLQFVNKCRVLYVKTYVHLW